MEPSSSKTLPEAPLAPLSISEQQGGEGEGAQGSRREVWAVSRKEIDEMNEKVRAEVARNRRKYEKLIMLNPYFTIKLFSPANQFGAGDYNSQSLGRMFTQIDLLLEEGNLLDKETKKCELRRMQSDHFDPSARDEVKHHYAFLRKVWVDYGRIPTATPGDKLEELNKRVVMIKSHIKATTQHEKECYSGVQADHSYAPVAHSIGQLVAGTQEYGLLKQQHEQLKMLLEETRLQMERVQLQHEELVAQKDEELRRAAKENEELRRTIKDFKEQKLSSEKKELKLLEKVHELEETINEKIKSKLTQIKENSNGGSTGGLAVFREHLLDNIKFRKVEQGAEGEKGEKGEKPLEMAIGGERYSLRGLRTFEHVPVEAESVRDLKDLSMTKTRSSLLEARSIDGKKGRFNRMRSPGQQGRLIKDQRPSEEMRRPGTACSPSLSELKEPGAPVQNEEALTATQ